jgi:hypothetical protein
MRELSESLTILIATAEDVIRRPVHVPGQLPASFAELAAEIRHADARPAEAVRTTRAAIVMLIAIEEFFAGPRSECSPWLMLAGASLPLLRVEAWQALNNERAARGL